MIFERHDPIHCAHEHLQPNTKLQQFGEASSSKYLSWYSLERQKVSGFEYCHCFGGKTTHILEYHSRVFEAFACISLCDL